MARPFKARTSYADYLAGRIDYCTKHIAHYQAMLDDYKREASAYQSENASQGQLLDTVSQSDTMRDNECSVNVSDATPPVITSKSKAK